MILIHESGAQEDQFDGKKEGQKSRGTIPLSYIAKIFCEDTHNQHGAFKKNGLLISALGPQL